MARIRIPVPVPYSSDVQGGDFLRTCLVLALPALIIFCVYALVKSREGKKRWIWRILFCASFVVTLKVGLLTWESFRPYVMYFFQ